MDLIDPSMWRDIIQRPLPQWDDCGRLAERTLVDTERGMLSEKAQWAITRYHGTR